MFSFTFSSWMLDTLIPFCPPLPKPCKATGFLMARSPEQAFDTTAGLLQRTDIPTRFSPTPFSLCLPTISAGASLTNQVTFYNSQLSDFDLADPSLTNGMIWVSWGDGGKIRLPYKPQSFPSRPPSPRSSVRRWDSTPSALCNDMHANHAASLHLSSDEISSSIRSPPTHKTALYHYLFSML